MIKSFIILCLVLIQITTNVWAVVLETHQRLLMDYNWKFIQSDAKDAEKTNFDDAKWRMLNLPHDWSIEGEFKEDATSQGSGGYLPMGIGWYRKQFTSPEMMKYQQFSIEFDGVYMNSDVWINGQHLGKHVYGYTGFSYNLTPYLKKGKNTIAVRVDNSLQLSSRWYTGSGIYRHVWMNITNSVNIARWGTYITTPQVDSTSATISVRTSVENSLSVPKKMVLKSVVKDGSGKEIASIETPVSIQSSGKEVIEQTIKVTSPVLWSVEDPALYTLNSFLIEGKKEVDNFTSTFGIRSID
jgi:beta-galactosidase